MTTPPDSTTPKICEEEGGAILEGDLARQLGVGRDVLKKLRGGLTGGVDFTGGDGRPIVIAPSGLVKLRVALSAGDVPALEKNGGGAALDAAAQAARVKPADVELTVVRVFPPRVLLAKKDGEDAPVRLRVRTTLNFIPGMRLAKCHPSAEPGLYHYHGRQPRRRGVL